MGLWIEVQRENTNQVWKVLEKGKNRFEKALEDPGGESIVWTCGEDLKWIGAGWRWQVCGAVITGVGYDIEHCA